MCCNSWAIAQTESCHVTNGRCPVIEDKSQFVEAQPGRRGPITIAFLFYLVTVGAIISACLRTLTSDTTGRAIVQMVFIGIAIGLVGGGVVGVFYFRTLRFAVIGTLVGTVVGAIAGGLALVDNERFVELASIAFCGSWLMIVVMLVAARFRSDPQV